MPLYKYNCTLCLIYKLYPRTLLYMQPLHKIFVVTQSHECRLPLWKLLHLNPRVPGLILKVIHHIFMKSKFINIYFSNFLLKWLNLTLWITKPIKLISREYFIYPLRDYVFHLEKICFFKIKCGYPTYWDFNHDFRSHSWYIKVTYTLWSGSLFS